MRGTRARERERERDFQHPRLSVAMIQVTHTVSPSDLLFVTKRSDEGEDEEKVDTSCSEKKRRKKKKRQARRKLHESKAKEREEKGMKNHKMTRKSVNE